MRVAHHNMRPWIATLCVAVLAAGIIAVWHIHSSADGCRPVRAMIDFNRAHQDSLRAETYFPGPGSYDEPRAPTEAEYRSWADGLQQHAAQVSAPRLASHARRAADLAEQSLTVAKNTYAESDAQGPLSQTPPPSLTTYALLNREFVEEIGLLQAACPS